MGLDADSDSYCYRFVCSWFLGFHSHKKKKKKKNFVSASLVLISFLLDSYFLSICKRLRCLFVLVVIYRGPSHLAAHWCIAPLIVVSGPIVVSDGAIDLRYATIDNNLEKNQAPNWYLILIVDVGTLYS